MIKARVTRREVKEGYYNIIRVPYCAAQYLLNYQTPRYYIGSDKTGWQADVYEINAYTCIVTGYAPIGNIEDYKTLDRYEKRAEKVLYSGKKHDDRRKATNRLLNEFIKTVIKEG